MNNKQKNRKNKTSQVYSLLPEYQYVTGMPQFNMGGQAYDYDHFMTNQLFKADDGEEIGTPNPMACPPGQEWNEELQACTLVEVEVEGNGEGDKTNVDVTDGKGVNNQNTMLPPWMQNSYQIGPNPYGEYNYGDPYQNEHTEAVNSIMDNSLLGAAFMTANSLKGAGSRIKKAFANINPKTGLPYSHTDFGVSTITNTTDENVVLDPKGLAKIYDEKGRIIDEFNTADNLFMTQNEAKANYFNQGADYHASTFIDENEFLEDGVTPNPNFGKSLMSKQQMDKDGNITYADIEYDEEVQVDNPNYNPDLPISDDNQPFTTETVTKTRTHTDDDLTVGDNVQTHIKDLNASRILFNDDNTEVTSFTRNNITNDGEDGQKTIEQTIAYDPEADYTEGTKIEVINRQEELNQQRYGYELPKAQLGYFSSRDGRSNLEQSLKLAGTVGLGSMLTRGLNTGITNRKNYKNAYNDYIDNQGSGWYDEMCTTGNCPTWEENRLELLDGHSEPDFGWFRDQDNLFGKQNVMNNNNVLQKGDLADAYWQNVKQGVKDGLYTGAINYGLNFLGDRTRVGKNIKNWWQDKNLPTLEVGYLSRKKGGDLRKFIYAQEGVETDAMTNMQNEYDTRNVGHFVETSDYVDPSTLDEGVTAVNSDAFNTSNTTTTTSSDGDVNSDYSGSYIENARNSTAGGTDNVRVDRNWLGKLFNRIDLRDADITNKRDVKRIEDEYGMSIDELINSGRYKIADDGTTLTNTPYVASMHSRTMTNNGEQTFDDVYGMFSLPNEKNQFQGGFGTSVTTDGNVTYDQDADSYWKNIGQYSTGEDNIYSNPEHRGSFLQEVKVTGKYGGQLAYFQNGGAPQPSGRTYKIDGRVVTKEEYDNHVANGGQNATVDDDNIAPPTIEPLVPPIVPQYGPQNAPVNVPMIDEDEDNIPDTIDVDAGGGTNEPVEGVEPYSPTPDAPVEFAYTDKPELTEEQMAMMTEDQIEEYNKMRGKEEWWNENKAKYNTSALGRIEKGFTAAVGEGIKVVDFLNKAGTMAQTAVDEKIVSNANDEFSDFAFAVEASRSDKGDFDVNSGAYRVNTLGYGDGPRGQIAQMGTETGGRPAPNYAYLKEFLDTAIVGYDPSFLMAQARDGEEIEANMDLIKQLMAAGADFEII